MKRDRFDCPKCGEDVMADEDGCCSACGRDAIIVEATAPTVSGEAGIRQWRSMGVGPRHRWRDFTNLDDSWDDIVGSPLHQTRTLYPDSGTAWGGMDVEQREGFIRSILHDPDTLALVLDVIDPNQVILAAPDQAVSGEPKAGRVRTAMKVLLGVHEAVAKHHDEYYEPDAEYNDLAVAVEECLKSLASPAPSEPREGCTDLSATWCPVHGDCTCDRTTKHLDDSDCPLHNSHSDHPETVAEPREEALRELKKAKELAQQGQSIWTGACGTFHSIEDKIDRALAALAEPPASEETP